MLAASSSRFMSLIMIKPTHYDDDGYPITWYRSIIPSNTLASLNGLATDCNRRKVLGDNVELVLGPYDECNRRIQPKKIISSIRARGGTARICWVGVQSNQFPRAVDLAKPFLEAGLPVALGGFHVAGCLSMLDDLPPEIRAAMDLGITMFAGEAEEGRLDEVLLDAWNGTLKPLYTYIDDLPTLDGPTNAGAACRCTGVHPR
jgi:hypothetical protein